MLRRLAAVVLVGAAYFGAALAWPSPVIAQVVSQRVAVCDRGAPNNCVKPNSDGSIDVSGSITADTSAVATASAPVYAEGTSQPLSMDLNGNLRTAGGSGGGTTVKATAASPTYVEGSTTNPLSTNLTADLRVIAKIASSQTVGISGTLPAFGSTPAFTIAGTLPAFGSTPTFNCGTGCSGGGTTAQGAATGGVTGGLSFGSVTTAAPSYTTATVNSLSLTTAGALRVDGSAVTQPVSGTVTANIGTGVGSLATSALQSSVQATFGAITGQRAVIYDASGTAVDWSAAVPVTQSGTWNITNVSGTVSLPTGAATSAIQSSVIGTKAAGTAATSSELVGGVYNTSLPTLTNGQQAAAQMDSSGRLIINCGTGCSGGGGSTATTATAADPTYVEGSSSNPISVDLTGYARSLVKGTVTANLGTLNGAATAAKQPALGTAGTASADVISVQGIASMTPVQVSQATASNLNAQVVGNTAAGAADSGNGVKISGIYNASPPSLTTTWRGDAQMDSNANLRTRIVTTQSTGADALANSQMGWTAAANANTGGTTVMPLAVAPIVFNATSWDRIRGDTAGLVVQPFAMRASRWNYAAASGGISNTTTAVTIKTAAGASTKNCIAALDYTSDTLGAATELAIRDGAGGTVLWRTKIQTGGAYHTSIPFEAAVCGSDNTLLEVVTLTASVTGAVYFNARGYTGP